MGTALSETPLPSDPTLPHLSFGLFQAQRHFLPSPSGSPQPQPPRSFTIPEMGQGPAHCSPVGGSSWLSESAGVLSSPCAVLSPTLHNCMLCASNGGLYCSPHIKTQAPPVLHTHAHTRRWARPRPDPVPQGLGLDLTKGSNKSRQAERDLACPADGRKKGFPSFIVVGTLRSWGGKDTGSCPSPYSWPKAAALGPWPTDPIDSQTLA